jgi:hypothetical protein
MSAELVANADRAMIEGKISEAIRLFEQVVTVGSDDHTVWLKLAALYRRNGAPELALDAVNAAIDARPPDPIALLLKGGLHQQLGERGRAAEVYRAALFHAASLPPLPALVAKQLDQARTFVAQQRSDVIAGMPGLDGSDPDHRSQALRLIANTLDRRPVFHQEPTHYRYPGLAAIEFFDSQYAALKHRLRSLYPAIRAEFETLAQNHAARIRPYVEFTPGQPVGHWRALNNSARWSALHLVRYGEVDPVNAAACPQTMAAFAAEGQPDIPGLAPNIMFSLLAPHTSIPAHHGVANFRAVLHLPLIVPPGCQFRVGADTRTWIEGEPWVFDDTIEHEAWNRSPALRVVLIADLWRPELDPTDQQIVRDFIHALGGSDDLGAL